MSCCRRLCFPAIAGQVIHTKLWIIKEKKKQKKKYSSNSNIFNEIDNANLKDKHLWAFGCYLLLLYLYSAAVGVGHSNEFPACSNTRP